MRDALNELRSTLQQSLFGHDLIDQPDAQRFLGIDMIAGKRITQRVFESGQRDPDEIRVGAMTNLRLSEYRVVCRDRYVTS